LGPINHFDCRFETFLDKYLQLVSEFDSLYIKTRFNIFILQLISIYLLFRNAVSKQFGDTALICAAAYGHTACVRLLAEAGADKEAKSVVRGTRDLFPVFVVNLDSFQARKFV
jgi:ankyrin repeat protein